VVILMNIKQLETFLLIAHLKNFTKAAAQLDMSQPAVSFQIKSLEEDLNISLFERNDKKVHLTEAGRLLYPTAMQMVRQYNKIKAGIDDLREIKAGHLMLGATPVPGEWMLPMVIGGFREQYPAVTVSMQVGASNRISRWLQDREVDMAILGVPVKLENVECQPWLHDYMSIITPRWHPLAGKEVSMTDLTGEAIVLREVGSGSRLAMEREFARHGVMLDQFASTQELGSVQAVVNAVRLGLGIGVVSRLSVRDLVEKDLLGEVRVADLDLSYDLYLAWNRPGSEGLAARAFRAFITSGEITERLKQNSIEYI
jgi:DNA-binding transcriptional LysR family regulator